MVNGNLTGIKDALNNSTTMTYTSERPAPIGDGCQ